MEVGGEKFGVSKNSLRGFHNEVYKDDQTSKVFKTVEVLSRKDHISRNSKSCRKLSPQWHALLNFFNL
jgi:hypothetical protein